MIVRSVGRLFVMARDAWQRYNGLRLSGIRAHHVPASNGWSGANGHSKRVLGNPCGEAKLTSTYPAKR
jgi:hypothetical protein